MVAFVTYSSSLEQTGWDTLTIETGTGPLLQRLYFAGYLEALVSYERILDFHANFFKNNFAKKKIIYEQIKLFFNDVKINIEQQLSSSFQGNQVIFSMIAENYAQLKGIEQGLAAANTKYKIGTKMDFEDLIILQSIGELNEITR